MTLIKTERAKKPKSIGNKVRAILQKRRKRRRSIISTIITSSEIHLVRKTFPVSPA